jgi:hypothetical protein
MGVSYPVPGPQLLAMGPLDSQHSSCRPRLCRTVVPVVFHPCFAAMPARLQIVATLPDWDTRAELERACASELP